MINLKTCYPLELRSGGYMLVDLDSGEVWTLKPYAPPLQSPLGPATSPQTAKPEPSPDKPKRGPGRPRKVDVEAARLHAQVIANSEKANSRVVEVADAEEAEFRQCRICGQEIVASIFGVHFENCRAARQGYTSHQANPGKP